MRKLIDLTGRRFGRLTVLRRSPKRQPHKTFWLCLCDCGSTSEPTSKHLRLGDTTSCGCSVREILKASRLKHGHCGTPTWNSWSSMLKRCRGTNKQAYQNYRGRGITVCARWLVFENFLADVGLRPAGTTLDRINNDGNYEPGNCRWSTPKEQSCNLRKTRHVNDGHCYWLIKEASEIYDVKYSTLRGSLYRKGSYRTPSGVVLTLLPPPDQQGQSA